MATLLAMLTAMSPFDRLAHFKKMRRQGIHLHRAARTRDRRPDGRATPVCVLPQASWQATRTAS